MNIHAFTAVENHIHSLYMNKSELFLSLQDEIMSIKNAVEILNSIDDMEALDCHRLAEWFDIHVLLTNAKNKRKLGKLPKMKQMQANCLNLIKHFYRKARRTLMKLNFQNSTVLNKQLALCLEKCSNSFSREIVNIFEGQENLQSPKMLMSLLKFEDFLGIKHYGDMITKTLANIKEIANESMCDELFSQLDLIFPCLILLASLYILSNCKKKSRLKYRYEKVTLLILWRCGDVEQNPGPAISDIARDLCKKMISLLVVLYQERQLGRRPIQADYKKKPAGWPDGIEFKDPSKCTNVVRDNMLNTIQKLCISSGVEVPIEWTSLYEKYQELQTPQCTKAKKEEIAGHLHSWLSRRRKIETTDQLFDSLPEMSELDRAKVLEHMIERLREFKPNLSTQNFQSQKIGSESREMETCSQSTVCVSFNESTSISVTDTEKPADDMNLARSPGTSEDNSKSEVEGQSTANKGFVTENAALESAQAENFTSFLCLLNDDFGCFAASVTESDTEIDTLPNAQDSNNGRINTNNEKHMKRKNDTSELENDRDIAVKRYKTADPNEAAQIIPNSSQSDSEEMLPNYQNTDMFDNATDEDLDDLMNFIIEHEVQVPVPYHGAGVMPDNLAQVYNVNDSLMN